MFYSTDDKRVSFNKTGRTAPELPKARNGSPKQGPSSKPASKGGGSRTGAARNVSTKRGSSKPVRNAPDSRSKSTNGVPNKAKSGTRITDESVAIPDPFDEPIGAFDDVLVVETDEFPAPQVDELKAGTDGGPDEVVEAEVGQVLDGVELEEVGFDELEAEVEVDELQAEADEIDEADLEEVAEVAADAGSDELEFEVEAEQLADTAVESVEDGIAAPETGHEALAQAAKDLVVSTGEAHLTRSGPHDGHVVPVEAPALQEQSAPRSMQWTMQQLIAVFVAFSTIAGVGLVGGWLFGSTRPATFAARTEFIYSLQDSVPDGFLREDRRILTQLVTIESDTTLAPVAAEFDLSVTDLRDQFSVEVVDLSEVLRLETRHEDEAIALALNTAIVDSYQQVSDLSESRRTDEALQMRREDILLLLGAADTEIQAFETAARQDIELEIREDGLSRQLDLAEARLDRLSTIVDDSLTAVAEGSNTNAVQRELDDTEVQVGDLEQQLLEVRSERAEVATNTTEVPELTRRVDRLEAELTELDTQIRDLEIRAATSSPIEVLQSARLLEEPVGNPSLRWAAIGFILSLPFAALGAFKLRGSQRRRL